LLLEKKNFFSKEGRR